MKCLTASAIFLFFAVSLFSLEINGINAMNDSDFPLSHNLEWKNDSEPELLLDFPGVEQIKQRFFEIQPEIAVEKLYRIPLGINSSVNVREIFLKLANIFGNPETQTKYLYKSARRNDEVPLIDEAYICSFRGRKAAPLLFNQSDIPGRFNYFQYVDEINFSGMIMNISLNITDDFFYFTSTNTESLKFGIFPLISKESIFMDNFIFLEKNMLYVYSITQLKEDVKIKKIGPYTIRPAGMFGKRMDVMANWIRGEIVQ
jgi:hypothetical protein